jgi:hypothetical protein
MRRRGPIAGREFEAIEAQADGRVEDLFERQRAQTVADHSDLHRFPFALSIFIEV